MSKNEKKNFLDNELESMKIDKGQWNEILEVSRKKLLKVFLAGAVVATLVWGLIFFIYIKTGFVKFW